MSRVGIAHTEERRKASSERQKKLWVEIETVVKNLQKHTPNQAASAKVQKGHIQGLRNHDLIKNNWAFLVRGPRGKHQHVPWDRLCQVIIKSVVARKSLDAVATELGYTIKDNKRLLVWEELSEKERQSAAEAHVAQVQREAAVAAEVAEHNAQVGARNAQRSSYKAHAAKSPLREVPKDSQPWDEKRQHYEDSASQLRMAIWFIKQVGDVDRARDLLLVAADAMKMALTKI